MIVVGNLKVEILKQAINTFIKFNSINHSENIS